MDFYNQLTYYYDEIFTTSPDEMNFLASRMPRGGRLLDIGCGTGNKTVLFRRPGNHVTGVDLDPGMIAAARLHHAGENIIYDVLDMRDIGSHFPPSSFDGVICLGNSLVHLESLESIRHFFADCHTLLTPNGVLALQILNYDRILDGKFMNLPDIDTEHTLFRREYAWRDGSFRFLTSLYVKEQKETLHFDIPLYPLRKTELADALADAGFRDMQWYGTFNGDPHNENSFVTISLCRK